MSESTRQLKVSRLLQRDLSEIIVPNLQTAYPGSMVTLTKVHVSPDLGVARIYLSIFQAKPQDILNALILATDDIRYQLGKRIRHQLRVVPELNFYIDDSLDYMDRIDQLLKS